MFGVVTPTKSNLSKTEIEKYRAYYCGLCHELKRKYGKDGTSMLSYDMVFLSLLLTDLYNTEITGGFERCIAKPLKEHKFIISRYSAYSADMQMLLSYYSELDKVKDKDDERDERKLKALSSHLKDLESGNLHHCFVEMSICEGSCINGPMVRSFRGGGMLECHDKVTDYAAPGYPDNMDYRDFTPQYHFSLDKNVRPELVREQVPGEKELREILEKMGKFMPEQELNCGSCGYPTCREKAKAVYNGKAEITMCLPYMKERAESFSDKIISSTPNAILVLDENLVIQQLNQAACHLLGLSRPDQGVKRDVSELLDPTDFAYVLADGRSITDKKTWLGEIERFVEETIVYDMDSKLLIALMKDITEQQRRERKAAELRQQTIEVTDRIVEKQMRVVQEIASLLGETTAETKVALTKLKKAVDGSEERQ